MKDKEKELRNRLIIETEENHKQLLLIRELQSDRDTLEKIKLVINHPNSRVIAN